MMTAAAHLVFAGLLVPGPWICAPIESPVRASATLSDGRPVVARDGRLSVGERDFTVCDDLPGAFPTAISVSPRDGAVYVGFRREGVFRFDPDGDRFIALPPMGKDVAVGGVRALAVSDDGHVLAVGTGHHGVFTYAADEAPRQVVHAIVGRQSVFALRSARDGHFDVAMGPYGAFALTGRAGKVSRRSRGFVGCFDATGAPEVYCAPVAGGRAATAAEGALPSGHVSALATSSDGDTLFVGTFDAGVFATPDGRRYTPIAGVPPFINALAPAASVHGDVLLIGTARGLYRLEAGATAAEAVPGLPAHVTALAVGPSGTVAVGTNHGVQVFTGGTVQVVGEEAGLPGRQVWALAYDAAGGLFVGTADGLFHAGGTDGIAEQLTHATGHLPHDWVTAIAPDADGGVFVGTYDAGVVHLARAPAAPRGWRVETVTDDAWVNPGGLVPIGASLLVLSLGAGAGPLGPTGVRSILPAALDDATAALPFRGRLYVGTRGGLVSASLDWYRHGHANTPTVASSPSRGGEPLHPRALGLRLE